MKIKWRAPSKEPAGTVERTPRQSVPHERRYKDRAGVVRVSTAAKQRSDARNYIETEFTVRGQAVKIFMLLIHMHAHANTTSTVTIGLLNKAALWSMAFGLVALHKLDISVCNFDHNRLFCVV